MDTNWDERYRQGSTPWVTGMHSAELARVLDEYKVRPGRALDLGCGIGTNVIYLVRRGFDATGVDLSPTAIDAARQAAAREGVKARFEVCDVLAGNCSLGEPFSFIFDRGCFHVIRQIDETTAVRRIHDWLAPGGLTLVLAGNANETREGEGPPRVSAGELVRAFEPGFEIVHLREFRFSKTDQLQHRPLAWSLLMRKRAAAGG